MKKNRLLAVALCLVVALIAGCSQDKKQETGTTATAVSSTAGEEKGSYPVPELTFLCSNDAGEAMSNNTYFLTPYLEEHLRASVDVINMGGSVCWVGWKHLTESPTDGSMISYANFPNMLTGYLDPAAPIGMDRTNSELLALYTSDDSIIMTKKDETRFRDAKEFFEYAKDNIVTIGTAGARTDDTVAVATPEKELGFELQHVHYQNPTEGFAVVMGGHIDVLMGNVSGVINKGEEIMPVVVLSQERSEYLPDVQCTYGNDIKVAVSSSHDVIAAKGLDPAAKGALLKVLRATMEDPDQLAEAKKQGIAVTPIYGDDFERWMEQQEESIKGILDLLNEQ